MKKSVPVCIFHPDTEAVYKCEKCGRTLCDRCVERDGFLFFCRNCRGPAHRMVSSSEPVSHKEVLSSISKQLQSLSLTVINHVILPAAIILMVGAFLFFLLDLRSVFLGDSAALKKVGLCFCAAIVLIVRYGKVYGMRGRRMVYTLALGIVMGLAIMRISGEPQNILVNFLVVAAVWWFANSITNSLDIKEEEDKALHQLYGVERLHREDVLEKFGQKRGIHFSKKKTSKKSEKSTKKNKASHGNPSSDVARFAAIALVVFALGEPFLLSGPPETGERALIAVIVFLFAAGIVLSTGSAIGTFRYSLRSGGTASFSMIPWKMTIGFVFLVIVLAVSLTVPGVQYRGSGEAAKNKTAGNVTGKEETKSVSDVDEKQRQKTSETSSSEKKGIRGKSQRNQGTTSSRPGPSKFFEFFASLGMLLLIPFALLFLGVSIYFFIKLWPLLKGKRMGISDILRNLLDKLSSIFRVKGRKDSPRVPRAKDPLKTLRTIQNLQPREAILTAYCCLQFFFSQLGHHRPDCNTPYEVLNSLPRRFKFLKDPAFELTELYVCAAYSPRSVTDADRKKALDAIFKVQNLLNKRLT